ncbi:hypothetical protein EMIHUDRAFT_367133, partial [Emiliania huxleyi CCMP1516]|uniref:Uncharacterized protein n=2 Tax=Emiliania huxleyi TaxID=2903 RepID=A0A0D3JRC5_EMIH1
GRVGGQPRRGAAFAPPTHSCLPTAHAGLVPATAYSAESALWPCAAPLLARLAIRRRACLTPCRRPQVGSWYFAPRRFSSEPFDEAQRTPPPPRARWRRLSRRFSQRHRALEQALDETRAGHTLLRYSAPGGRDGGHPVSLLSPRSSGPTGAHVSAVPLGGSSGAADPSRGVSALKLLPGRRDVLVALKTEESGGRVASYLSILRSESGEALMPDAEVAQGFKFEGLEVSVPTYV